MLHRQNSLAAQYTINDRYVNEKRFRTGVESAPTLVINLYLRQVRKRPANVTDGSLALHPSVCNWGVTHTVEEKSATVEISRVQDYISNVNHSSGGDSLAKVGGVGISQKFTLRVTYTRLSARRKLDNIITIDSSHPPAISYPSVIELQ